MLPGEIRQHFLEAEAFGLEFGADFSDAHFVFGADGDVGILFAKLQQDELAARLEGVLQLAEHELGFGELVVDINQEDEVEGGVGEARVVFGAEHGFDIGELGAGDALAQELNHAGLNVCGVDFAGGADETGDEFGVVAGAGADIADDHAGLQIEEADSGLGAFFALSLGALEPTPMTPA
jgi:hypothetical protein